MEALRRTSPMSISFAALGPDMDGLCNFSNQSISIREGMSEVQTVCATVHEIAHAVLHNWEQDRLIAAAGTDKNPPTPKDNNTKEVEAESVSFAVCQYYGIDTSENSLGYIASWSKDRSLPELKASLETITRTVSGLISSIDKHFAEICKERGIDLAAQPEQAEPVAKLPDTPDQFVPDMFTHIQELYEAQLISDPLGSITRDGAEKFYLECLSHGDFSSVRRLLNATQKQADSPQMAALVNRLEKLDAEWDAGLSYEIMPYIPDSSVDRFFVGAYRLASDGFEYKEILFTGSKETCSDLLQKLESGILTPREIRAMEDENWPAPKASTSSRSEQAQAPDQALYLIDDAAYLHVQLTDSGVDYTFFDKETMRFMDGGQLDYKDPERTPEKPLESACQIICAMEGKYPGHAEPVSLDMLEILQEAEEQAVQEAVAEVTEQRRDLMDKLRDHIAAEDNALWEITLDEYPRPDPDLTAEDLERCGYLDGDLLPLSKDRAAELIDKDMTVYILHSSETPVMAFDREEVEEQSPGVLFAVPCEEWEESLDFRQAVADRLNHQPEREAAFLNYGGDCFAIYQVRDDPILKDIRFESLDWLKSKGHTVERENYDLIYTVPLPATSGVNAALEQLWYQFNNEHPADYQSPSMSVSDIIAIKMDGVVSCHYCDSYGFQQLPDFIRPENYLKNAEMATEDDFGMIDGIINNGSKAGPTVAELEAQVKAGQTISLTDLAGAVHRERGEKKSVIARLQQKPPRREHKRSAPKKSAERER